MPTKTVRATMTALALLGTAGSALADPLETLLAKGNGAACWERVYDEAHLAKHPEQRTLSMLVSLRSESDLAGGALRIQVVRQKSVLYIVGDCGYAS